MNRNTNYPGQVPLETDLLKTNQFGMVAVAKLSAALFGGAASVVNGLAVTQSVVPALSVLVAAGEIYSPQNLEASAYSSLPADTAHTVTKQGISLDPVTLAIAAPTTAGFSIAYLVQAAYQDSDTGSTVLPYYNATTPAVAYSGPANSGTAQPTTRAGIIAINAKAGVAATTGAQVAPAPDTGYVGLYVVTVANGALTVINANIAQYVSAPALPAAGVVGAVQSNALINAQDTGTANAYVCAYSPAIGALADGMVLWFKAATGNTGASTLKINALTAVPLVGGAHSALQGGEIVATGKCMCIYNATLSAFVLLECTGGAVQVAAGTKTGQAVNLSQFPSSISSGGWEKLPNGRIKQWFIVLTNASGYVTATFPIAFPNAFFGASLGSINTGSVFATWQTPSNSSILVQTWNAGGVIGNSSVYVEATGY